MKNNLFCTANERILWLSKTYDGSIHDKKILDEQPLSLSIGITIWQDTSFLGLKPDHATIMMPTKKLKGKQLINIQKDENKKISSFRILVEHVIDRVKKCCIVKERFRCRKFGYDDLVMLIACGLHNFRVTNSLMVNIYSFIEYNV